MKKLLNVLFVTNPEVFLTLENENVVAKVGEEKKLSVPLLNLEGIVCFSYFGATSSLMGECAKRNITLSFLNDYGKYIGTLYGMTKGNVLLRKEQYRISDDEKRCLDYAIGFIFGKLHNQRTVIDRAIRDHYLRINIEKLQDVSTQLKENQIQVLKCDNIAKLRAIEGNSAQAYFKVFDELILQNKQYFYFATRNRRPPTDSVNAMLSLMYTLLMSECRNALEVVGLDSYVGFMHTDRPGRASLALDLMEELRPQFADRFVLTLINRKEVSDKDFEIQGSGACLLTRDAKSKILNAWQLKKKEIITHPFLGEKIEFGLVPYVQALLLSRVIRKNLDNYPPFLWK